MAHEIDFPSVPARTVAVTRFHVDAEGLKAIGERMGAAFQKVIAHLGTVGVTPAGAAVARYHPTPDGFDVAAGFLVAGPFEAGGGVEPAELPAGEVAHTTHLGPYDRLPEAYGDIQAAAASTGRTLGEDMWEEYWSPPDTPAERTRTEIYWPIAA